MNMFRENILQNKVILITGSTNGIGKFLVQKCKEYGGKPILSGRNSDKCKRCSDELKVPFVVLDVTKPLTFPQKIETISNIYGDIDILVNNAGVSPHKFNILKTTLDDWKKTIGTNCMGAYFLTKYFLDYHINRRNKDKIRKIIFTASNSAINGYDDLYPLSKNFLVYFAQCIGQKYFNMNIRINCVSPSGIENNGMNGNLDHTIENSCKSNLSRKSLSQEEVANLFIYLMSNESNSVNGANFVINEGKHY